MEQPLQHWWLFAGKLHPVVVHFPIAILLLGAALEFLRFPGKGGQRRPARAAVLLVCIGALAAVLAAALGWSDASTAGHQGSDAWVLSWHRWVGVITGCFAVAAAILALVSVRKGSSAAGPTPVIRGSRSFSFYRLTVAATALLVAVTGHFGGMLIYGTDYVQDAWTKSFSAPPASLPGTTGSVTAVGALAPVDFTRDVQPILARRCYQCHAGDKVESDLHLDSREGALRGGKSGRPAIVPGGAGGGELLSLIKGEDPKRAMPPKGGALEPQQIAVLQEWIAQGAKWSSGEPGQSWHWAYRAPVRVNPPAVKDPYWPRNPIDQFILGKLEAEGLGPSMEADKRTLLRRVTLDLIGLPPTPAEIDDFLADPSAQAYERVVDRLLGSPHYGEKMAVKWLDLARYADTHGYEKDQRRTMWPYREWVIDALNRDLPFDRFTVDQLAGDLLPQPSIDQLIATGFNRNTQINEEGGNDPEEFRVDAIIDRTNTVGTVWLGTTIGCAQCHNHKNDPIPQDEYYRFLAYFNNDVPDSARIDPTEVRAAGGMLPVASREHRDDLRRVQDDIAAAEAQLARAEASVQTSDQDSWERTQAVTDAAWSTLRITSAKSTGGATLAAAEDGTLLASGASPETDTYTVEVQGDLPRITALRLEVMPDDSTPGKGVGRSPHGNIVLTSFIVTALPADQTPGAIAFTQALADFEQIDEGTGKVWKILDTLTGDGKVGWAFKPQEHQAHQAIFRLAHPIGADQGGGIHMRIVLGQGYGGKHTIGRLRLSATADDQPLSARPISQAVAGILAVTASDRTPAQREELSRYFLTIAPSLTLLRDQLGELKARRASLIVATAMIMKKAENPRETYIFERGSFLTPGKRVDPGVPAVMLSSGRKATPPDQPRDRLGLARWIVSEANPLTARVQINHIWEQHFGRGLVETTEDFGTQGDYPTHPELLDWLATEFLRQGWSMKAMHRLIVTSAAYRQSSNVTKELLERDPYDKLLTRGPRLRVEAETVRDIALAAGGLLCDKVGGPSVFPPQPSGIWTMIASNDTWVESKGEDRYRRGLYTFVRRTAPYPSMTAFDSTSREILCTRRARTDTPLQAMTTLNDPQFVEAAVGVGARMLREGGKADPDRIRYGFVLCTARQPGQAEVSRLLDLLKAEREHYTTDQAAAEKLLGQAPGVNHDGLPLSEVAAWSVIGNVILNLDETITRE